MNGPGLGGTVGFPAERRSVSGDCPPRDTPESTTSGLLAFLLEGAQKPVVWRSLTCYGARSR